MEDNKVTKSKKKKLSSSAIVIIVACLIILIPVFIFLGIIASSAIGNSKPVLGNRFNNDLNPAITSSNQDKIASEIKALSNVDSVEIVMPTAQLRINVDASNSSSKEDIESLGKKVYEIVDKEIPVSTYFTMSNDGKKMYDLEINVYNYIPEDTKDEGWISYLVTKNSKMETFSTQFTSEPKSPELAAQLNGEVVNETADTVDDTTTNN